MDPQKTRQRFAKMVAKDSNEMAAARLGCSVTQVIYIADGRRNPGLRLACAIEEVYAIPMKDWVAQPAARAMPK